MTATVPAFAMASIPSLDTSSRCEMASQLNSRQAIFEEKEGFSLFVKHNLGTILLPRCSADTVLRHGNWFWNHNVERLSISAVFDRRQRHLSRKRRQCFPLSKRLQPPKLQPVATACQWRLPLLLRQFFLCVNIFYVKAFFKKKIITYLGMEWAPKKVEEISMGTLARAASSTLSILISVDVSRPYPDLHSTVVVPKSQLLTSCHALFDKEYLSSTSFEDDLWAKTVILPQRPPWFFLP